MSLRTQAEADLAFILEDDKAGFGWEIHLTDPTGKRESLVGYSGDVSSVVDPSTGAVIVGTICHCALRVSTLRSLGFAAPTGTVDKHQKPWIVEFDDLTGERVKFAVQDARPDRTLGIVVLVLASTVDG